MDDTSNRVQLAPAAETPPVSAVGKRKQGLQRARTVALALIVPVCLMVIWDVMVRWTGTRLVPSPYGVAVMMWDFAFGGIYDDAYSASLPIHFWKSV